MYAIFTFMSSMDLNLKLDTLNLNIKRLNLVFINLVVMKCIRLTTYLAAIYVVLFKQEPSYISYFSAPIYPLTVSVFNVLRTG